MPFWLSGMLIRTFCFAWKMTFVLRSLMSYTCTFLMLCNASGFARLTGEVRIASAKQVMQKGFLEVLHRHRVDMILIAVVAVMMIHALYCYSFSDSGLALTFSGVSVVIAALAYLLIRTLESG